MSAIAMTKNQAYHSRTKHIDIRYHFIRNLVTSEDIVLKFCNTKEQVADILTKALPLENMRTSENIWEFVTLNQGGVLKSDSKLTEYFCDFSSDEIVSSAIHFLLIGKMLDSCRIFLVSQASGVASAATIWQKNQCLLSDSFDDSVPQSESNRSFEEDNGGYADYNSQQFDSFSGGDEVFESHQPVYGVGGEFKPEENGKGFDGEFGGSDGPILPPSSEMGIEEGFALREWRRENALRLEEKEKREKELLKQIIQEADEYKVEFYRKREITLRIIKPLTGKRRRPCLVEVALPGGFPGEVFVANRERFHAEADNNYWKAIAELIPNEVPAIEKKRGKKDQEKKPGIVVIQGPKPGKPTELSRMRQILIKLKHNTPPHLKHSPPPAPAPAKDGKTSEDAAATASVKAAAVATTPEAVAVT
ncbi:hypothetical protein GH714_037110 [Hevea brasiliensis]|uniref:Uncharacterized protein n=1 Tax=Hevea brasiliensis TaxID=3981 RepID=A0A6A6L5I3_HEVBR|nr:hypothetical protein GH714_037110 [Hevea brasiliensis]